MTNSEETDFTKPGANIKKILIPVILGIFVGALVIFALAHKANDSALLSGNKVSDVLSKSLNSVKSDSDRPSLDPTKGEVALSSEELKEVVRANKLIVFWAGPQDGAKYSLTTAGEGIAYVRYLPDGIGLNDKETAFRAVGTYPMEDAFNVNQSSGMTNGNVGFTNADGNAVFYIKSRPKNVYLGIKGKNIQVEVFDPGIDQAIGLVLKKGQVTQII